MGAFIRSKGKWDHKNAPSNRELMHHNDVVFAIVDAFKWLDSREKQRERKKERNERIAQHEKAVSTNSKEVRSSSQDAVAPHNVINAISDQIPASKLTEQTRSLFKGKTFEYMARTYPAVLLKFLNDKKELCFPPSVLKNLIAIAKSELDRRASK